MPLDVELRRVQGPPLYQLIASQVRQFHALGFSNCLIADAAGVTEKTVRKTLRWLRSRAAS